MIGAGAAGCVIAGRLSQTMPEARIALIEAGGERLGLTTKIPGTAFIASSFARRNWNFETEPVPAMNGRTLRWFQGRILGGSSSINGMLYLRGHSLEYGNGRSVAVMVGRSIKCCRTSRKPRPTPAALTSGTATTGRYR